MKIYLRSIKSQIDKVIDKLTADKIEGIGLTDEEFKDFLKSTPTPYPETVKYYGGNYFGSHIDYREVRIICDKR